MVYRLTALIIGYGFGLFQTAYLIGRMHGIDIRTRGSGNAGTTNAMRTMGKRTGIIVMIADILKCILAVFVVWLLIGRHHPEMDYLLRTWTGFGCVIGHNYPFYMGFRGGKGMACTTGFINSISWQMTVVGWILFFGALALTHYVSLGSLLVAVDLFAGTVIMGHFGMFHLSRAFQTEMDILAAVMAAEMFYRHHNNIAALIRGTERKTYLFRKGDTK